MSMAAFTLSAIVLAAGEGSRMRSERPKPLHRLCGRPMVLYVLDTLAALHVDQVVVVVGHRAEWVTKALADGAPRGLRLTFVHQEVQRGTGDAVAVGLTALSDNAARNGDVLVVPGDTPLMTEATLRSLVQRHCDSGASATLLSAEIGDPTGYGRVVRGRSDDVLAIVEECDATDDQRRIREVNTSVYCFRHDVLAPSLRRLRPTNTQGEYYLTDVIAVLHAAGFTVDAMVASDKEETQGVNDRVQLAAAEAALRRRINERWMREGVTMIDPSRVLLDASVKLARDVTLWPGTILKGATSIGEGTEVGPETTLVDCEVGSGARIVRSHVERARVGADVHIGPFSVVEPGSEVKAGEVVAPFTIT